MIPMTCPSEHFYQSQLKSARSVPYGIFKPIATFFFFPFLFLLCVCLCVPAYALGVNPKRKYNFISFLTLFLFLALYFYFCFCFLAKVGLSSDLHMIDELFSIGDSNKWGSDFMTWTFGYQYQLDDGLYSC